MSESIKTATVDVDSLLKLTGLDDARGVASLLGIDLERDGAQAAVKWRGQWDDHQYTMRGRCVLLGVGYALRWTHTDEAGVSDVELVELAIDDDGDAEAIAREWAEEIVEGIGYVVDE